MRNVDSYSRRESGQFECWDSDGKRKELGGYDGNEKCWLVVCVRD